MFRVNRDSAVEIELYRPAAAVNEWSPSPKKLTITCFAVYVTGAITFGKCSLNSAV